MPRLTVMLEGAVLRDLRFAAGRTTIGRRAHNDIVLDSGVVSGEHAMLVVGDDGHLYVQDLGSRNGTSVNGEHVTRARLRSGDVIRIGAFKLRYSSDAAEDEHGQVDLDTQIGGTPSTAAAAEEEPSGPSLRILTGPQAGSLRALKGALTTLGKPREQVAVISRRPTGYVITLLEGREFPLVNGVRIGPAAQALTDGDRIEVGGAVVEFCLPRVGADARR